VDDEGDTSRLGERELDIGELSALEVGGGIEGLGANRKVGG